MKNKYEINNDVTIIYFKNKKILIDTEDLFKINKHSWCISKTGYVISNINKKLIKLHRLLLNVSNPNEFIDHINGNPLDNRKCNLRKCNNQQNCRNSKVSKNNTTGVLGVSLRPSGRYRARIMVDRKEICLGTYDTIEEAKNARKKGEEKYFKEFSPSICR